MRFCAIQMVTAAFLLSLLSALASAQQGDDRVKLDMQDAPKELFLGQDIHLTLKLTYLGEFPSRVAMPYGCLLSIALQNELEETVEREPVVDGPHLLVPGFARTVQPGGSVTSRIDVDEKSCHIPWKNEGRYLLTATYDTTSFAIPDVEKREFRGHRPQ